MFAPYRGQYPQNREKRVSESTKKKNDFPPPRKGCSESKNPHFYTEHHKENGDFLTRNTLVWGRGICGFLTPKPSFADFGDFDPVRGKRIPKA